MKLTIVLKALRALPARLFVARSVISFLSGKLAPSDIMSELKASLQI